MILLVLSREERVANVELIEDAAETPHVDCPVVWYTEDDFGCSVESRLDISVYLFVLETATAKINDLDT